MRVYPGRLHRDREPEHDWPHMRDRKIRSENLRLKSKEPNAKSLVLSFEKSVTRALNRVNRSVKRLFRQMTCVACVVNPRAPPRVTHIYTKDAAGWSVTIDPIARFLGVERKKI